MSRPGAHRIVSLLPATTDTLVALGCEELLVGCSHECDTTDYIEQLPACTEPKFAPFGSSRQIDQRVSELIGEGLSVYRVDEDVLRELNPDLIITQDHCEVCAAPLDEVRQAVTTSVGSGCRVLSVSPNRLDEVWDSIRQVGNALQIEAKADELVRSIESRMQKLQATFSDRKPVNIATIEWIDPLMTAGNWTPELITAAGGKDVLADEGAQSHKITLDQLSAANPDFILVIPCGFPLETTREEMPVLAEDPQWQQLKAVQQNKVALADGNKFFNRPGPFLVDSAEIVAEILHPDLMGQTHYQNGNWEWWNPGPEE